MVAWWSHKGKSILYEEEERRRREKEEKRQTDLKTVPRVNLNDTVYHTYLDLSGDNLIGQLNHRTNGHLCRVGSVLFVPIRVLINLKHKMRRGMVLIR